MPLSGLSQLGVTLVGAAVAAVISALLIVVLKPLLQRYALARPNARSSHSIPTPQGGGIAVIAATAITAAAGLVFLGGGAEGAWLVMAAAIFLAIVGIADDLRTVPVTPRLLLQTAAVIAVLVALPTDLRIAPWTPWWLERGILLVATLWFVNLVNFMDGLDWMTVAEMGPVLAALTIIGPHGDLPGAQTVVAIALGGALLGFAPFNRPVARLFLGDVGSLPIGLLVGWLLITLASQHLTAALLLPLYYVADATLTLIRRLLAGEKVWVAHRSHFYQRATDNGFSVIGVVTRVFVLNILLCVLAATSILWPSVAGNVVLLLTGCTAVAALLIHFSRQR
jgi:UDP-N-acetylmuramyl pentapeptide phosphotransferase/UDP-N-acetylglucosamine-1-phosphate transferase